MRFKEVCVVLAAILLVVSFVYSAPNPSVSFVPVTLYESNTRLFNVSINNWFGNEVIDEVVVEMPMFTVPAVVDFLGWQHNFSSTQITWNDGDIETNSHSLFQYAATAGLVNEDTAVDVPIKTTGDSGEITTDVFHVTVLNDGTAPELSNNVPSDGGYLREGRNDQPVSVQAEDPETGIYNASFSYWDCSANVTEATVYAVALSCADSVCTNAIDLSEYKEGELMCFNFAVYNNAMDASTISGSVGFDGTPPSVLLIAPEDGAYGSSNTEFIYNATDNLAPTLSCELIVDGESIDSATAASGAITTTTYDMTVVDEGEHSWLVRCTDWVELGSDSETRSMIVDKTAPVITLNSPAGGSFIGDNVMIDISVTDNYEVGDVDYSISRNSSELPEGANIMTVTASDKAGNVAVAEYAFTVDRTPPAISVVSPENFATIDVHSSFVFDTNDNLDPDLLCSLYVGGALQATQLVNSSETSTISLILPISIYEWHLTCMDHAGNSVSSEARTVNITDLTGPDIMSDIVSVARAEDYPFSINVTDISGVVGVNALFNGNQISLVQDGDIYSGSIQTNLSYPLGVYSLIITAVDTYGNTNTLADDFNLVQGYAISLALSPSDAETGQGVTASGTVILDDGGVVPEDHVSLSLPSETVDVSLTDGAFSRSFAAPSDAGAYTIGAAVVSADGFSHRKAAELNVHAPAGLQGGGGGHAGNLYVGTSHSCGDGDCQTGESCKSCAADCGACPAKKEEPQEAGGDEIVQISGSNITDEVKEELTREASPGVGEASGWFRRAISNPWVWALFLLIIGIIYLMSSGRQKVNWNGYFNK